MTMNTYKDSFPRRFAKAAVLATGFGTIWLAAVLWLGSTAIESGGGDRPRVESLAVADDGTPLIQSYPQNDYSRRTFRDLDGRERPEEVRKNQLQALYLGGEARPRPVVFGGRAWAARIKVFVNERDPAALWYFLQDDSPRPTGYFVGYEQVSNRMIGYIGLGGFREGPPPPDERIPVSSGNEFVVSYWSSLPIPAYGQSGWPTQPAAGDIPPRLVHVPSGNVLRVVDLGDRTVRTAYEAPGPIVSVAIPYISGYSGSRAGAERSILVRTAERVYRLDHSYKVVGTFPIPPEVGPRASISWYETDDGRAVASCDHFLPDMDAFGRTARPLMIYQLAADGAIRAATPIELKVGSGVQSESTMAAIAAASLPGPASLVGGEALMAIDHQSLDYPAALGSMLRRSLPALGLLTALSTALAAAAWMRCRAYALPTVERAAWAGFVWLFGLAAWVGFRLHRRWPALAACPSCRASSPRDRPSCASCGEPFPAPALKGTEVFA